MSSAAPVERSAAADLGSRLVAARSVLPSWYLDVVREAKLADYGPVRGTMVIRPYGYAIWRALSKPCALVSLAHSLVAFSGSVFSPRELIQTWLDREFKAVGVENAYFPQASESKRERVPRFLARRRTSLVSLSADTPTARARVQPRPPLHRRRCSLTTSLTPPFSHSRSPQLIPLSFIAKEAAHVAGFAPELALVTRGGGKELEEPLVVRPTSETIVNHMFAQWVQSYRDLPLVMNQWCNVHRWELRTRPFVRTLEFLWQEGHTAHASREEASSRALQMVRLYARFAATQAALPVVVGRKSAAERFAGAVETYTIEAMMADGRALQAGTSHDLGTNFAVAFGTRFVDEGQALRHVWQTSWGVSTRLVGGVVMAHGDDTGLRLPPALAPVQLVVVPIWKTEADRAAVLAAAAGVVVAASAAGLRAKLDDDPSRTPGWKYSQWEMKGVPLRAEVGPRDVAAGTLVLARRHLPGREGKLAGVPLAPDLLVPALRAALDEVQAGLLAQATAFRDERVVDAWSLQELRDAVSSGRWARAGWAGSGADEAEVKAATAATLRCFPLDGADCWAPGRRCVATGAEGAPVALFARSY